MNNKSIKLFPNQSFDYKKLSFPFPIKFLNLKLSLSQQKSYIMRQMLRFATFLLKFLKVSFLKSRATARSSNTFKINLISKRTLGAVTAPSVFKLHLRVMKYLHFDLGILKVFFLVHSKCWTLEKLAWQTFKKNITTMILP